MPSRNSAYRPLLFAFQQIVLNCFALYLTDVATYLLRYTNNNFFIIILNDT